MKCTHLVLTFEFLANFCPHLGVVIVQPFHLDSKLQRNALKTRKKQLTSVSLSKASLSFINTWWLFISSGRINLGSYGTKVIVSNAKYRLYGSP